MKYSKDLKEKILEEYTNTNIKRKEICEKYDIPIETFKGWLKQDRTGAYGKNYIKKLSNSTLSVIKKSGYNEMSKEELQLELIKKDFEIAKLKKKYPWLTDMDDTVSDGQSK